MDTLYVDCGIGGISGDMLISALLDLSDDPESSLIGLNELLNSLLPINPVLKLSKIDEGLFQGRRLKIQNEISMTKTEILKILKNLNRVLNEPYLNVVSMAFDVLIQSEISVHGDENVELHELGSSDTLVDLISVAYLLQLHGIAYFDHSPVAIGSGSVKTSHGTLPVPPPVSLEIIKKFKIVELPTNIIGEAATPTGLALLASLARNLEKPTQLLWIKSSCGFGSKMWPDRANVLRIRAGNSNSKVETINLLETNIDDLSGEHLGGVINVLMEEGALDVNYFPIFMKKNRPGYCLRVLCTSKDEDRLIEIIMRYTGTLGIRSTSIDRHIGHRSSQIIKIHMKLRNENVELEIPIKIGKYKKKIEFDYLNTVSKKFNIPPLELERLIWKELNKMEEF